MAKRDKRYDWVYSRVRDIANETLREFKNDPDGGVVVAGAQAEAFVRTLKGYTLRHVKTEYHARYLHNLFTQMLKDVLDGMDHLSGRMVIVERPKKKK